MCEQIDWLKVVLDYGKRFPDAKLEDFGLDFMKEIAQCKIKDLQLYSDNCLIINYNTAYSLPFGCVGNILYYGYMYGTWEPVPSIVLLRLLTEGEEDFI